MDNDNLKTALQITASVLEAVRPYCLLELTTKFRIPHAGQSLGSFTIDEALDLAEEMLGTTPDRYVPVPVDVSFTLTTSSEATAALASNSALLMDGGADKP